jgi:hypothetical protein
VALFVHHSGYLLCITHRLWAVFKAHKKLKCTLTLGVVLYF